MRILVTNDDGIESEGLLALARALTDFGEVVVVAPDRDYSGSSAGFGPLLEFRPVVRQVDLDVDGAAAWSVTGPPALCVILARLGAFGELPDLVVSGINPGANVGRAVAHSGTIGAVVTGRLGGISGIAVSQAVDEGAVVGQAVEAAHPGQRWQTAAVLAGRLADALLADLPPRPVALNLNVPNLEPEELKGWRRTTIATEPIRAMQQAGLVPIEGDPGAFHGVLSWGDIVDLPVDTDGGAVEAGYVSVTWLANVAPEDPTGVDGAEAALDRLLPRV